MMKRYADEYGEGGWQGRLREVIGGMTIVTPGVLNEGATVSHPAHGVGRVEFWRDKFPMARVKFAGGTEKIPKRELTLVTAAKPKPTINVIWDRLRPSRTDWSFPKKQVAEAVDRRTRCRSSTSTAPRTSTRCSWTRAYDRTIGRP